MTYEESVKYLNETAGFAKKTSLDNIKCLLECLGNPQEGQRFFHVAGTNGKGSVCAFLEAILEEEGIHTAVFSSPHLVCINERIRIGQKDVTNRQFAKACSEVRTGVEKAMKMGAHHPSFFEYLFLMAMIIFREEHQEYCIIETGMGGRYDATNVLVPEVSILTTISQDHMEFLGKGISEIAYHKAGIIKEGKPVVCAKQKPEVMKIITGCVREKHAKLETVSEDNLKFQEKQRKYIDFLNSNAYDRKRVVGEFQKENLEIAIRAARYTGHCIRDDVVYAALEHVILPGRMEEIISGVFTDVAHNIQGMEAFCETVEKRFPGKKRILFAASHKNEEKYMRELLKEIPGIQWFGNLEIHGRNICQEAFEEAFEQMMKDKDEETICFVVGSFYLAGITKQYITRRK